MPARGDGGRDRRGATAQAELALANQERPRVDDRAATHGAYLPHRRHDGARVPLESARGLTGVAPPGASFGPRLDDEEPRSGLDLELDAGTAIDGHDDGRRPA
jgi:hypothetical protein